jgi:predicted RNA binding protein with dsRBD fold (UPF0201 family)
MEQVTVRLETEINSTESEDKVKTAVNNIFSNLSIAIEPSAIGNILNAKADGHEAIVKFRNLLRNDRIRDAARKVLFRSISGNTINFCLNKQVAFAGHVSFCEENAESPLGPIKITIETNNSRELIEWLAEKTV